MPSSYTSLKYHLIWSTKYRRPVMTDELRERLFQYIGGIVRNDGGSIQGGGAAAISTNGDLVVTNTGTIRSTAFDVASARIERSSLVKDLLDLRRDLVGLTFEARVEGGYLGVARGVINKPGEESEMTLLITAPKEPGEYIIELDMVQEAVSWFGDKGSPTTKAKVTVVK